MDLLPLNRLSPRAGAGLAFYRGAPAAGAPALLWGHANGFATGCYRALFAALAPGIDLWAWDARGQGASSLSPDGAVTLDRLAEDAALVCAAVRAHTGAVPHVAAHSFSGVALVLAAADGVSWPSATLFEPPLVTPDAMRDPAACAGTEARVAGARRRRRAWASPAALFDRLRADRAYRGIADDVLHDHVAAVLTRQPDGSFALRCAPETEAAVYEAVASTDPFERLDRLSAPAHFVASAPPTNWLSEVQPLAACRARGTWEGLADTSHLLPLERPDACAAIIRRQVALAGDRSLPA